jgi:ribulose-phosphate 3-epimerase
MIIAPSILNADNLKLGKEINTAKQGQISRFHIDIMDGHFVPNLSFGPELVSNFKKNFPETTAEVHLMSDKPDIFVPAFVKANADLIEIHYEAMSEAEVNKWLDYIKAHNVKAGLVLNPDTLVDVIKKFAKKLDQVLLMTVYPGFGGQKFIENSVNRIKEARELLNEVKPEAAIEVDGGINNKTIVEAKNAGANVFVVGSYIFKSKDIVQTVTDLKKLIEE